MADRHLTKGTIMRNNVKRLSLSGAEAEVTKNSQNTWWEGWTFVSVVKDSDIYDPKAERHPRTGRYVVVNRVESDDKGVYAIPR